MFGDTGILMCSCHEILTREEFLSGGQKVILMEGVCVAKVPKVECTQNSNKHLKMLKHSV